jgi:phosphoribosylformylglycinamidine synthase
MVSICKSIGLNMITRIEKSQRYIVEKSVDIERFIALHCDRMTESVYHEPIKTFDTGIEPEAVYAVDMISKGHDVLKEIPGISMDEWDRNFYYDYFVKKHGRNPTIVEIMDLNNANSEHSRHGFFSGRQIIDGQLQEQTLFELVKSTLKHNPRGSVVAFKDNSSVVRGTNIRTIVPEKPGEPSGFTMEYPLYNILLTVETHNFPTGVAPFPGAETGTGGRIRDVQGTGKGGFVVAGTAGYCVGSLHIPGYDLPWEMDYECPSNLASALKIEIEASNGASDYGNKFGEPLIQGFTHSFDMRLSDGERWGFIKPIMFTGGIGQIDQRHIKKDAEVKGMIIVQVGGPAYRVGFGGGAASSMLQGENEEGLDFNAVQRGDAEMEQKMNRVIRACNEMGDQTLIDVIHDQGAGGPANVLKELVEHSGGYIDIRKINVGDSTMSVLEIYVAEFQERMGFLISPENIARFQSICNREKVACEVLGKVTGDMQFVVRDNNDNTIPVDLDLSEVLGGMPQKTFEDLHVEHHYEPFVVPTDLTIIDALMDVFRLVSIGSKQFLTNKVDRSVTGLIVQQQCVGPLQIPLADVAVVAQSHFGLTGGATAIGEQPMKMIVDPKAGARMAVGEALTNLVWARVNDLKEVKCSANWMWAPKLSGEGAAIRDAVASMCDVMKRIGIAVDGGKDSFSMATIVGDETVKSPRQLVVSLYGAMDNILEVVTPDIKCPGNSQLLFIDLAKGKTRLGGSALAQICSQLGNEVPDMEDPELLRDTFWAVQYLIKYNLILAGHDVSDGGLITTLFEMAFAGDCGFEVHLQRGHVEETVMSRLFAEELGIVIECDSQNVQEVMSTLGALNIPVYNLGDTCEDGQVVITYDDNTIIDDYMCSWRQIWSETSYQIERLQKKPACADAEKGNCYERIGPEYFVPFTPMIIAPEIFVSDAKPKVAILREEGSNSDREMTSAFFQAGFEPWDITMTDLIEDKIDLNQFRGLAAVGGFSYADVPESAKGWAATIVYNEKLKAMFEEFYYRPDTFTLGICNGAQLFGLLGWVPWREIAPEDQPRFVRNDSDSFESRWSTVRILPSNAMMFRGMTGMTFGIHVAHGEGKFYPSDEMWNKMKTQNVLAAGFVDDDGHLTEDYPLNPNGSRDGITAICSPDGRHLAMMPHPERTFLPWQCHWVPEGMKQELQEIGVSPWMRMFQNAYAWCIK